jgi:hypothetical protein
VLDIHVLEERLSQQVIKDMVLLDDIVRVVVGNVVVLRWMLSFCVSQKA